MEQKTNDKIVINRMTMIFVGIIAGILLIIGFVVMDWIMSRNGSREEKVRYIDGFNYELSGLDSEIFGGGGINAEK